MAEKFFDEQLEQSEIKTAIVSNYFVEWARVITGYQASQKVEAKIAYVDLFAGPGRYKDGASSTPLFILEQAIQSEVLRSSLVTIFNDGDEENTSTLKEEISKLPDIAMLKYPPQVDTEEVGEEIVKQFEKMNLIPTLMFVDPWGYKGLSLRLVNSVLKDWACECIFFFNYTRINMGLSNERVKTHMEALFGEERAAKLMQELELMNPDQRELTIVERLVEALTEMGGKFVLPFGFKNASGNRTKHHLIFVSKHPLGYKIMKRVMYNQSSSQEQDVASFEYSPATEAQPFLFGLTKPLDQLEGMLLHKFAGQTLTMDEIYDKHNYGLPYIDKNYKDVLTKLEQAGKITGNPAFSVRRKIKGEITCAGHVKFTFPSVK